MFLERSSRTRKTAVNLDSYAPRTPASTKDERTNLASFSLGFCKMYTRKILRRNSSFNVITCNNRIILI